jgi:hypothetical protein
MPFTPFHMGPGLAIKAVAGAAVIGRPICQALVRGWAPDPRVPLLGSLRGSASISWASAVTGAFVGTYSHVFLDSIMHADMRPFAPWSGASPLLGIVSVGGLHVACLLGGVLGALLVLAAPLVRRGARTDARARATPSDTAREDARS